MKVRVLRPLCVGGVRKEVGEIIADLPNALEAISSGRAERVLEAPPPPVGPMTTETVPAIVAGKKRKHAQKEQEHATS